MLSDVQLQLLTHYALGELPPARLPEIEALLAAEPEARAWVDEVRRTGAALGAALAAEPAAGLDSARKAAIAAHATAAKQPLRLPRWLLLGGGLAAAGLALALVLPVVLVARHTVIATRPVVLPADGDPVVASRALPAETMPAAPAKPVAAPEEEPPRPRSDEQPAASGREEVVVDSRLGGQDAFVAIGRGGGASGQFGSLPRTRRGVAEGERDLGGVACWPQPVPPQPPVVGVPADAAGESYARIVESSFQDPRRAPLSTFGLDVDTAAYANVRRFIGQGRLPPPDAVRIEELLNAFSYADPPPPPGSDRPFAIRAELAACPWSPGHRLARIAIRTVDIVRHQRPPANLVFLVDVSGSMGDANKLPLVKTALTLLAGELRADDRVAIVTYADSTRVALPSTPGSERTAILRAIAALETGGSTNGGAGLQLAYRTAQEHAVAGTNRVFLCTDGDFNIGVSSPQELKTLAEEKRRSGITISVLGFGMGNLKDANLQALADSGNGAYAYIGSEDDARRTLVRQLSGQLVMVAKDAKVQVEFNPARVASWRLIGYEKRLLQARDFANDRVDSGDIGAGAHVTALYELTMRGEAPPPEDGLRYQGAAIAMEERWNAEVMFVKLRWKRPDREQSELLRFPVMDRDTPYHHASADFRFAAAVAAFGLALRDSPHRGSASLPLAEDLARISLGEDRDGQRSDFVRLVQRARELAPER